MSALCFRILLPLAVVVSLAVAGCGDSSDSPVGPSSSRGATIRGTVLAVAGGDAAAASVHTASAGPSLRVTVVGTSLSTTTNASGEFTLENVPPGTIRLRFEGPGIDATIDIVGVTNGQTITITVRVSGSQAVVLDMRNEIEFTGTVQAITPPTLRVSGLTVVTNAGTEIEKGDDDVPLTALQVGDTVKVEGTLQADGSVLAREIKANGVAQADLDFEGTIEAITPPSLRVAGRTVVTNGSTEFKGEGRIHSLADLRVGDLVEVEGTLMPDGSVLASEIDRKRRVEDGGEVEFEGMIESLDPPNLQVAGRTVVTDANTEIERDDDPIAVGELAVGERVEVEGTVLANGSILATKIEVDD